VVAGLAAVGEHAAPAHRIAAGEGLVRVVDDGREPHRAEAHAADVVGVVGDALEVAAEVAGVGALAGRRAGHGPVEAAPRRVGSALLAEVVAGVPVDEAVGHQEVDRLAGEGLQRAVELVARGHGGRRRTATRRRCGTCRRGEDQRKQRRQPRP